MVDSVLALSPDSLEGVTEVLTNPTSSSSLAHNGFLKVLIDFKK